MNKNIYFVPSTIALNPNYLYCENESLTKGCDYFIPPFMATPQSKFELGDRVVNINTADHMYIPFGMKGTVTAVCQHFLEVMFDYEFFGGSTFGGRFDSCRGAFVDHLSLINLTK